VGQGGQERGRHAQLIRTAPNEWKLMVYLGAVFAEEAGRCKQVALTTASMMVMDTSSGLRD
jgi:hypothetical protein